MGARATSSVTQTIPAHTSQALAFDGTRFDEATPFFDLTTPTRLTVPTGLGGNYVVRAQAGYNNSVTFFRPTLRLNGTENIGNVGLPSVDPTASAPNQVGSEFPLSDGDYVEVVVENKDNGIRTILAGAWLSLMKVG